MLQSGPLYPSAHLQVKVCSPSIHSPPFLQGLDLHSSISLGKYFVTHYSYVSFQARIGVESFQALH